MRGRVRRGYLSKIKIPIWKVIVVLVVLLLFAIGWEWGQKQKLFTTELSNNTMLEVGGEKVSKQEFMLYLVTIANTYSDIYGEDIWNITSGEQSTIGDDCIQLALAEVSKVKVLDLLATSHGVVLDEEQIALCEAAANAFISGLSEQEAAYFSVDLETVKNLYEEKLRGELLYELLLADVTPEISDEEARIITVQHILLKTYNHDEVGNLTNQQIYEEATEIRRQALDGESFESLMSKYNEDTKTTYTFGKGMFEESFETAAFALSDGEISSVITTSHGYHIIKCITSFDKEATEKNKLVLMELRKQEAFGDTYETFLDTLEKKINTNSLATIEIPSKADINDTTFFTLYEEYIQKVTQS